MVPERGMIRKVAVKLLQRVLFRDSFEGVEQKSALVTRYLDLT